MGVAGNTTDLKLADTAGKRAKARGTLAQWNERRATLEGQVGALTNELAQLDSASSAKLDELTTAKVLTSGCLHVRDRNDNWHFSTEATLALRDHLCSVLGLPDRFQDVTFLSHNEASTLVQNLTERALYRHKGIVGNPLAATVRGAIFDALDHVGVIQDSQPNQHHTKATTRPSAPASAAGEPHKTPGTAGSAQNPNAASEDWESLHGVNVDGNSKDAKPAHVSALGANKELARATDAMLSIVDQFTSLVYRLTKHGESVPSKRVDVSA